MNIVKHVARVATATYMRVMELLQNSIILQFLWSNPYALAASVLVVIVATVWIVTSSKDRGRRRVGVLYLE